MKFTLFYLVLASRTGLSSPFDLISVRNFLSRESYPRIVCKMGQLTEDFHHTSKERQKKNCNTKESSSS